MSGLSAPFTASPQLRHLKALIVENPGNKLTAPQYGHVALSIVRVRSISVSVWLRASADTVRTTAPHSLHTISA